MQEGIEGYVNRGEFEEMRVQLFGNRKPQFEGDVGAIGKLDARVARIERIIYAVGVVLVLLQLAQPYLEKAFAQ